MGHRFVNILLGMAVAACAVLIWNLEPDPAVPGVQYIPEMHYSIPFKPQSANPLLPNGMTLQPPPRGTIARGFLPIRYEETEAGRQRAGRELVQPFSADSAGAMERGRSVYSTYCQPCHGTAGEGDGIVTKYGFPPPPSFGAQNVTGLRDGEIFHTITFGRGNMPGLGAQVSREDRWNAVLRVRDLQESIRLRQRTAGMAHGTDEE